MSSAWLLPEHLADVLPHEARRLEELRRTLLDAARSFGHELVMPPLAEHLDSLLSGSGESLDLMTFKLVDQLSGRTLGVRADTTPQVARIDAHLLNRAGVTRLCYCGPVLHALPAGAYATREPLQFGAETYGHAGLEADLEIQDLAIDCLGRAGLAGLTMDLGDARIVTALLDATGVAARDRAAWVAAMVAKDRPELLRLIANTVAEGTDPVLTQALLALPELYGGLSVLDQARQQLPALPAIEAALHDLAWLAGHLQASYTDLTIGFDLADLSGYAYYTGPRFALYGNGSREALLRGGRYDAVGQIFGRSRPAVGFSLDLKSVVAHISLDGRRAAIRAPWNEEAALRAAIRHLRVQGETVTCVLPGHEHEADEFDCDRELVEVNGQWVVCAR
ncbi:ATP phosphoribosyltransferase involved in histidine biosynthesis [Leptothrix ochracea L12]|uniref:ATP phosphoribosyltransferase regulatory subunit n=1 Tax=Leptothrix ochracea L12 TaxID=735332 RepID=I4Z5P1_9BURK|nr:ATP phosphoribosyltransferase regulatory subunit [Leptothrix ochracea]EIM31533.1 ATP phosphoribosyltransferase involved in histidine biosynthesis [Leptothrix ochracea L12]